MFTNYFDSDKIGANIKHLIKKSKYPSQEKFAVACKTKARTVSRWIQSGVDSIDTINLIAKILEVDVRAILY